MKVKVLTLQTDGDVYVQGVYRNLTNEQIMEPLISELSDTEGYEIHDMETSTKASI